MLSYFIRKNINMNEIFFFELIFVQTAGSPFAPLWWFVFSPRGSAVPLAALLRLMMKWGELQPDALCAVKVVSIRCDENREAVQTTRLRLRLHCSSNSEQASDENCISWHPQTYFCHRSWVSVVAAQTFNRTGDAYEMISYVSSNGCS